MRLPTKTEVEKAQILERQQEAKEGLAIARKVDAVRLELITEQNNLEKFRKETSVRIQKEIDDLFHKKQALTFENDVLERHNKNLKAPFDEEWETIRKTRIDELDERMGDIERAKVAIDQEQIEINRLRAKIGQEAASVQYTLEEASKARIDAKNELQEASDRLENAKTQVAEHQSRIDAENSQLSRKEEQLALQLRDIQVREAAIQSSVKELARRERFIKEKYEDEIKENLESLKKSNEEIDKEKREILSIHSKLKKNSDDLENQFLELSKDKANTKEIRGIAENLLKELDRRKEEIQSNIEYNDVFLRNKQAEMGLKEKEIKSREKQLNDAVKDLKDRENSVKLREERFEKELKRLEKFKIEAAQEGAEALKILSQNKKNEKIIEARLEEATRARESAKKDIDRAEKILKDAKERQSRTEEQIAIENGTIEKKVEEAALKLRDIQVREAAIAKSAAQLARRERFINSKYKVLMQTQNALRK
jgi:chromosome segregation ATPase